jgi:hypothetical protein
MTRATQVALLATVLGSIVPTSALAAQQRFPHETHSVFFPDCGACHAGVASGTEEGLYPESSMCAPCHDGSTAPQIQWDPPEARASSLRFPHSPHSFGCETCHLPQGPDHLEALSIPEAETCMGCHNPGTEHQQAEQCDFCHAPVNDFRLSRSGLENGFHGEGFVSSHGPAAAAGQPDCTSCHRENTCTQCHEGQGSPDFHPINFLASHGPEAYGRVSDCSSCHNSEAFCRECHLGMGIQGAENAVAPFHDNQGLWILSHPQAARQDLEGCVSCHKQTDCLRCHSAQAGLGIRPHGPGFDASILQDLNKATCKLCHGGGG